MNVLFERWPVEGVAFFDRQRARTTELIPVSRPKLPSAPQLLPYLMRVDAARYYTNHGQLVEELESRLASFFGMAKGQAVLASSGTAALVGATLATAGRARPDKPLCVCPAFTFVATGIAAVTCGYEPYIADVDADSWALDPEAVRRMANLDRVGLVVAVAPMGRTPDLEAWSRFHRDTGIPVVIDAAACFDTLDRAQVSRCGMPVVVSLHATKTFSTAEGGLILCADLKMSEAVVRALNFGFYDSRESVGPSTNGKLSEYHAAVGLADLDGWAQKRAGYLRTATAYWMAARGRGISGLIETDLSGASPYVHFRAFDAGHANKIMSALDARAIGTRRWYLDGLHRQPAFTGYPRTPMPVTEDLASRLVGLPVACDLDEFDIEMIVETLVRFC